MKVFDWAISQAWAMTEETLLLGLSIASRENAQPETIESQTGKPLESTRSAVVIQDGGGANVAVISIRGPIFRYANMYTRISGATSTEALAKDIRAAVEDRNVAGVVLAVDSPGGQATSIAELARMIRDLSSSKPIVAYVDGMAASGAYWLASAASYVMLSPTALVGSIGVVQAVKKTTGDSGFTEIVSSGAPKKRVDVTTEEGKAEIQRLVDELHEIFVGEVAKFRSTTKSVVEKKFGMGGLVVGKSAVDAGMADSIGSMDEAINLAARWNSDKKPKGRIKGGEMDWRLKAIKSLFGGSEASDATEDSQPIKADAEPSSLDQGNATSPSLNASNSNEEVARLKAELQEIKTQGQKRLIAEIESSAKAFVSDLLHEKKISPAESNGLATLYANARLVDEGVSMSVVYSDGSFEYSDKPARIADLVLKSFACRPSLFEQIGQDVSVVSPESSDNGISEQNEQLERAVKRFFANRAR